MIRPFRTQHLRWEDSVFCAYYTLSGVSLQASVSFTRQLMQLPAHTAAENRLRDGYD